MYCPVYGCNSDSQKDKDIHFFSFPGGQTPQQNYRRKACIEFCKRKAFSPTPSSRICSCHFDDDAYEPQHSPKFLQSIQCNENFKIRLKSEAIPTLNKPNLSRNLSGSNADKATRIYTEKRQRAKVRMATYCGKVYFILFVNKSL